MSNPSESKGKGAPLNLARRIDQVCDQFESAWREGDCPPIETFIGDWSEAERPALLRELIAIELDFRRTKGDQPNASEYDARFPGDASTIANIFSESENDLHQHHVASTHVDFARGEQAARVESSSQALGIGGVFGDYEIVEKLKQGGMGIVYRARQLSTDRPVALKLIRPDQLEALSNSEREKVVRRFQREARATAKIDHPNLVSVYEVGEIEGRHFYSMQFVDGPSLDGLLTEGPVDNRAAAGYLEPVARAVQEAHNREILHRDLKPHNILQDRKTGRTLVADFGLAKLREGGVAGMTMSQTGEVFGAPPYMAPEQTIDSTQVTAAVDIYGLGATLYHLLTGRPPFQASSVAEVLQQVLNDDPVAPRLLNPAVDSDIETICLKCLEKEPARRYASADDFADELRRYLDGKPILARPLSRLGRLQRWSKRNPAVAISLSALILVLISATIFSTTMYLRTSQLLADNKKLLADNIAANQERKESEEKVDLLAESITPQASLDELTEDRKKLEVMLSGKGQETSSGLRDRLAGVILQIGQGHLDQNNFEQAHEDFDKAISIWTGLVEQNQGNNYEDEIANVQAWKASAHVMAGDHAAAIENVLLIIGNQYGNGETFYFAGSTISKALVLARQDSSLEEEARQALVEQYQEHAFACLRTASQRGYFNRPGPIRELRVDAMWEPLRNHDDFVALRSDIQLARASATRRPGAPTQPQQGVLSGRSWRDFFNNDPGNPEEAEESGEGAAAEEAREIPPLPAKGAKKSVRFPSQPKPEGYQPVDLLEVD